MSIRLPIAFCTLLGSLGPLAAQEAAHLTLGLYSFKQSTAVYKQFQPVAQALGRSLTAHLERPATVELQVMKTYEECFEAFLAGKVDFVRFGPASYVLAKRRDAHLELLAAEREDSRGVGAIVVRDDSPFTSVKDLIGKRFAFGDQQSTIGRYLSQAELVRNGITGNKVAAFQYLDRHDIVFKAVELGDYDAGALHMETFKELNAKATKKLRVLYSFDNAPKPWIARSGLDETVVSALRSSLLELDDPTALKALKVPGFAATTDAEYTDIRKGMELSEKFAPEPTPAPKPAPAKEPVPTPAPAPGKRP
jgi:phosphonate transport system substrate-binding protein